MKPKMKPTIEKNARLTAAAPVENRTGRLDPQLPSKRGDSQWCLEVAGVRINIGLVAPVKYELYTNRRKDIFIHSGVGGNQHGRINSKVAAAEYCPKVLKCPSKKADPRVSLFADAH